MSKVININPIEQLKESLVKDLIKQLEDLDIKELQGLMIAMQVGDIYSASLIGMDFGLKGYVQAHLDQIGSQLLDVGEYEENDHES